MGLLGSIPIPEIFLTCYIAGHLAVAVELVPAD